MPPGLPAEWQLGYFLLTFFGWPIVILLAYFRGYWISRKQAEDQLKGLEALYREAVEQREKRIAELLTQYEKRVTEADARWRERYIEVAESRDQWRTGAQNLTGLTERIIESVERGMLTVIQTIGRTVEEAIAEALKRRKV
jgi:uncharacterized protein YneF (UPF0154 family)